MRVPIRHLRWGDSTRFQALGSSNGVILRTQPGQRARTQRGWRIFIFRMELCSDSTQRACLQDGARPVLSIGQLRMIRRMLMEPGGMKSRPERSVIIKQATFVPIHSRLLRRQTISPSASGYRASKSHDGLHLFASYNGGTFNEIDLTPNDPATTFLSGVPTITTAVSYPASLSSTSSSVIAVVQAQIGIIARLIVNMARHLILSLLAMADTVQSIRRIAPAMLATM